MPIARTYRVVECVENRDAEVPVERRHLLEEYGGALRAARNVQFVKQMLGLILRQQDVLLDRAVVYRQNLNEASVSTLAADAHRRRRLT